MPKIPTLHILVGLPGSGKSTWRHAFVAENPDVCVLSTDDRIDAWAQERGLTYTEAFPQAPMKEFETAIREEFQDAVASRRSVLVDRTNLSCKSRARFLSSLPKPYRRVAVVFDVPDDVLARRLDERARLTGKFIPEHVISTMKASFEMPDITEFDQIISVSWK